MANIYLKVPSIEDLHYRQEWMKDSKTMAYNAGYDIDLKGYDKETGTITKTDEEMISWYNNWINKEPDKYFAYIYEDGVDEPIGEVYYYLDNGMHSMGIVIQEKYRGKGYSYNALLELEKIAFEKNNISELSDIIPLDRVGAIKTFQKAGFIHTDLEQKENVFGKESIAKQLLITKEMYLRNGCVTMTDIIKQELIERNNRIIEIIMKEIQEKCPEAIDLIGIGGSFCNGDIYEKSDLDLVIIRNDDSARCLDKCFILGDVGFDVYTQDWSRFEAMAEYNHPYVTKLFDLNIVYSRNEDVLRKYKLYQDQVKANMGNTELVNRHIGEHFSKVLSSVNSLSNASSLGIAYRNLATIIQEIEFILFMANRTYVKRGTKRIPEEIANLELLPQNFLPVYNEIIKSETVNEIQTRALMLVNSVKDMLDDMSIQYQIKEESIPQITKKQITISDLPGTYEEVYSNWKNKMHHAVSINSPYLSFMTMSSCQTFYDEMADQFDIPRIELLENFNPDNLEGNANAFDNAMSEWKKLYDMFGLPIQYYPNLVDLENLYKGNDKNASKKI